MVSGQWRSLWIDIETDKAGAYPVEVILRKDEEELGRRRWIKMAQDCGIRYFEISHLYSQWGATMAPKVMGTKDGVYQRLFGWETEACGAEYAEFLHQFLTALKAELRAMNYLESKKGREAVMQCLEWGEYEEVKFRSYPRSAAYLTEMRRRVNEAIKE